MTRTEIDFVGVPAWILALIALGLLAAVAFGYRRDRGLVPRWVGRLLTLTRCAVVALILLLFLEGVLRRIEERLERGELLLILDGSRSMALKDEFRPGWQKVREAAALGILDSSLRETSAERAAASLPDLEKAEIPPGAWERIRKWAAAHGIPAAEIEAAEREISARWAACAPSAAGAPAPSSENRKEGAVAPGGAAGPGAPLAALRAALESLQRRLDEGLLSSGGEEMKKSIARLDPMGRLDLALKILERGPAGTPAGPDGGAAAPSGPGSPQPASSPLDLLSRRLRISAVELCAEPREVPRGAGGLLLPAPCDSDWTDLGQPILDEVSRKSRETLAGVVLISDGRHNRGRRPEEVMRSLGAMGIPLFALAAGAEEAPRDVRIAEIDATGKVYGGDEIKVDVAIEAVGMGALSLILRIAEGESTVKEVTAELPAGAGLTHVPVSFAAPAGGGSGRKKYTVSFPAQPGEVTAANNSRDFWVNILNEKARVLLIDGGPRWEYRYLKNTLGRDTNVKLDAFLVTRPPDRRLPQGFPRERDALFAYDVLMVGDVEASVFSGEELAAIRDFVAARGGSLVLIAGERAMPQAYAETALEELLPVRLRRPRPPAGEGANLARSGFSLRLTSEGERSPITRLVPGREPNRELWGVLPPMDWFSPTAGAKPQATVLVTLPEELAARAGGEEGARAPAPATPSPAVPAAPETPPADPGTAVDREGRGALMATLLFGAGRVFYSGLDTTWRWRYLSGDQHFARFWGQVIRWAASERLPSGDDHVRLGTDEIRYEAPAKITISAIVNESEGKPLEGATIDAVARHVPSGRLERARLQPIPHSGGRYRGSLEIEGGPGGAGLGEHQVSLDIPAIPGYSSRGDRASVSFLVEEAPSREAADLTRDGALLEEMVRRAAAGGRALTIDRAAELPVLLEDRAVRKEEVTTTEQWALSWAILILFAVLITAEWLVRKRFDLV